MTKAHTAATQYFDTCVFSGFRSEKDKTREHFPPKLSSGVRSEKDKENADLATGIYYA